MRAEGTSPGRRDDARDRSPAQWFCLLIGPTLVLVGLLGFFAEAKFDTATGGDPGPLDGEDLLIFEVNGWHNVVHIASGLLLLIGAARHALARTVAIAFGATYAVVSVIGLIDGRDVLGIIPIDRADNVLHLLLAAGALAAGLLSSHDRLDTRRHVLTEGRRRRGDAARATTTTR